MFQGSKKQENKGWAPQVFLTVPPKNKMGWETTFRDLTMPMFQVPKIEFPGGGPLFETLRCQLFKARKSFFWVGYHFSRPYDANFGSPKIDFWVGDQFSRPDDANFRRHVFLTVPAVRCFLTVLSHYGRCPTSCSVACFVLAIL